jgi:glycosyltransferase involved in cell wall biosynthesis
MAVTRVLQVVGGLNRGGAETWLMHVLRSIDRERVKMDFLTHTLQPGAYDAEARALGSTIIPCLHPRRPWLYARNLRRILREHGPYDIIHSHVYLFDGLPLWVAARQGVPGRISHWYPLTDTARPTPRRALYRAIASRLIVRNATMILADSYSALQSFKTLQPVHQPTAVVYCGIDQAPFARQIDRAAVRRVLGLPLDKPVIAYVARFVPHKNHAQLLRVANRLNQDDDTAHFAVAGSHGPLLSYMQDQARRRRDLSVLVGLPDVSDLLLASDLFFFPSLEEGFGIVAVEAAAAGLPIVATDLPTIREACPPSHHAFMFPPDDDDRAVASIQAILGDLALQECLSATARQWAPKFSIAHSVAELAAVYDLYRGQATPR